MSLLVIYDIDLIGLIAKAINYLALIIGKGRTNMIPVERKEKAVNYY
jgi:hypothetical protein